MSERRRTFGPLLLALLLSWLAASPATSKELEIHDLSYLSAEEVIPLIEPVLPPGTSLSGRGQQLIVRAPAVVQDEVRRLLARLDTAPRSLRISVRTGSASAVGRSGAEVRGDGSLRIYRSEDARDALRTQQIRGLEGRPVFIARSLSIPVIKRRAVIVGGRHAGIDEHTEFLTLSRGFYAIARLSGSGVEVDIAAEGAEPGRSGVQSHEVVTRVSGRLGEWLQIGGDAQDLSGDEHGIVYRSESARGRSESVWLRVETLD